MNPIAKIWLLRLAGILVTIPALFLVTTILMELSNWFLGDGGLFFTSIPILVMSLWTTCRVAGWTVFASRADLLSQGIRRVGYVAGVEGGLFLALCVMHLPERPYNRELLKFSGIKPATINVTGSWAGSWTDPRSGDNEVIFITLDQKGNTVTGTIHSEKKTLPGIKNQRDWDIIEGQISGDQINLYYMRQEFGRDVSATLLGVCKHDAISGEYFGHVAARSGSSSKGGWRVAKVKP